MKTIFEELQYAPKSEIEVVITKELTHIIRTVYSAYVRIRTHKTFETGGATERFDILPFDEYYAIQRVILAKERILKVNIEINKT